MLKKFESKLIRKEKIAKDTYTYYFERPKNFLYISGQYIKLFLEIEKPDHRGSSRHFTISSNPKELNYFSITTKIIKSSFKLKLSSLNIGEKLKFIGPIGYFDFNEKSKKQKIFLAGGIGITPFYSILKKINLNSDFNITLIVSFACFEDVIFYDELKKIELGNSKIKIIYTLSKESKIGFEKGRISKKLIIKYCPEYLMSEIFIVGSESFEDEIYQLILKMKVKGKDIFKENFSGY